MEYFLSVAEELHFGRAAKRVNISQPPLSRQIMELEEELGAKLFDRTSRGVRLTPAGEYLKKEAAYLLQRSSRIRDGVRKVAEETAFIVRLGFVGSAIYSFLPELLGRVARERKNLVFELSELGTDEQVRGLASGRIDIGFVRSWMGEGVVRFSPLANETLSIVYAESLVKVGVRSIDQLAGLPFIGFSRSCAPLLEELAERICHRAGFSPRKSFIADQYDSVLRCVAAGIGWAIVPSLAVANSRLELRSIELSEIPERIVIGLATRADESDPRLLDLIELIERYLNEP